MNAFPCQGASKCFHTRSVTETPLACRSSHWMSWSLPSNVSTVRCRVMNRSFVIVIFNPASLLRRTMTDNPNKYAFDVKLVRRLDKDRRHGCVCRAQFNMRRLLEIRLHSGLAVDKRHDGLS